MPIEVLYTVVGAKKKKPAAPKTHTNKFEKQIGKQKVKPAKKNK